MFKVTRTKPVPAGAEARMHQGKKQVRLRVDGKMQWVPVNPKGRAVVESAFWYARHGGKLEKLTRDRVTSETKLAAMRMHTEKVEQGLALPVADSTATVAVLVQEYTDALRLSGMKATTYERLAPMLDRMFTAMAVKDLRDLRRLTRSGLEKWATRFDGSAGNITYHFQRLKSFLKWLQKKGMIGLIPDFPAVKGPTRAKALLTPELESKLMAVAPVNRRLMYAFMLSTGARAGAAAALLVGDLQLDRPGGPVASMRPETQKNGKGVMVPMPKALAKELGDFVAGKKPGDLVFGIKKPFHVTLHFRADLKRAKIDPAQPDGTLCAHSLRHSFATRMLKAGISPALVAKIGNWSDLGILMRHYSHICADDGRVAVETVFGGG